MQIDQSGAIEKEVNGSVTQASFRKLRKIVYKTTFKNFIPIREELMRKRLVAFKAEKWDEYAKLIAESQKCFLDSQGKF